MTILELNKWESSFLDMGLALLIDYYRELYEKDKKKHANDPLYLKQSEHQLESLRAIQKKLNKAGVKKAHEELKKRTPKTKKDVPSNEPELF